MIPTYQLTGESVDISGRGTVFTARLTCNCQREDLGQLLGKSIDNEIIIGIESSLIPNQKLEKDELISLLVQKEKPKMGKEKFTVSWIMVDEKMIKFKEVDEAYDLSDSVIAFIEKNELHKKEGIEVEVEIDKSKGDGTVTSLTAVGDVSKPAQEEPKEETPTKTEDLEVKELTVAGVSVESKGVTFKEEEKVWYTLDDSINLQEFKDKYTKKTVEVSVRKTEKGNDVIVAFTAKEEDVSEDTPKEEEKSQEPRKSNGNMVQKSIEAQASINSANRVIAGLFDSETKPNDILKNITKIAEHNFELIQKLKNKE